MIEEIWHGGTPESYGSGVIPQTSDSKRMLWVKKLLVIQSQVDTPLERNNPKIADTIRVLKLKCVRAENGI